MMEEWRNIEEYEGLYQVSNLGRVKSLKFGKERILKPGKNNRGYLYVFLSKNCIEKRFSIHRLLAQAFIPNPDNLPMVNHKDECKTNNKVDNLEWCTRKYNTNYGTAIQRRSKTVYQYSLDGDFVAEYPSVNEIQRQLGFAKTHISDCCIGKYKQSYGYIWSYEKIPQNT